MSNFYNIRLSLNLMELSFSTYTNITDTEFIVRIFYGGQRVSANKKIVVMSWISLLCKEKA